MSKRPPDQNCDKLSVTPKTVVIRSFLRSRLARLIPASLICATLTFFVCVALHAERSAVLDREWLRSAFLPVRAPFIDSSYWTLPIELTFYSVVLALILLKRERLLPRVIGAVGVLSSAMWLVLTSATKEPVCG